MTRPSAFFIALAIAFPCAASAKGELINNTGGPIRLMLVNGTGKVKMKGFGPWKDLTTSKSMRVEDKTRLEFEVNAKNGSDAMIVFDEKDNEMSRIAEGIKGMRTWRLKGENPSLKAKDSGGVKPVITLTAAAK